jgi:hypothetical protein
MFSADHNDTKDDLAELGKRECIEFFTLNNIKVPKFELAYAGRWTKWARYGIYFKDTAHVNLKTTKKCVSAPGYSWTFTGFKADLTPAGVVCHECGHHLDKELKYISTKWKNLCRGEEKVSSYEPNASESFAEASRLYILNPNLLKVGRPKRYSAFQHFGVQPTHDVSWREVLKYAHPMIITAAENWIKKGLN